MCSNVAEYSACRFPTLNHRFTWHLRDSCLFSKFSSQPFKTYCSQFPCTFLPLLSLPSTEVPLLGAFRGVALEGSGPADGGGHQREHAAAAGLAMERGKAPALHARWDREVGIGPLRSENLGPIGFQKWVPKHDFEISGMFGEVIGVVHIAHHTNSLVLIWSVAVFGVVLDDSFGSICTHMNIMQDKPAGMKRPVRFVRQTEARCIRLNRCCNIEPGFVHLNLSLLVRKHGNK